MRGDLARSDATIAFHGVVTRACSEEHAEIELANGHRITAAAARKGGFRRGDPVRVELPIDRVTGWRFFRPAQAAAKVWI